MNGHVNVKKRHRFPWVPMIAALAAMFGCQERVIQGEGGSMDETSTLAFHRKDGSPAVGARVQLYGSADTGVEPRVQLIANAQGGVDVPVPAKGYYNLVVRGRDGDALFQDSLYSNGVVLQMQGDTLRRTGALTGRIRVQPQHSPRIAWIHVLGAGIWSNVDDSGRFRLDGVPAGRYTLAAYTLVEGYTPTFAGIKTISDSTMDAGDLQMVFTGLPVVRNLEARFDTLAGLVSLRWDSIALRETWRYNVYRNDSLLGITTGPRWSDDVSRQYPASVPAQGRHTYRVAVANADTVGPKWESITMQVVSAFLYEDVKVDWEKLSDLPWTPGLFKVDTVGGDLIAWKSAEFGKIEKEWDVRNVHPGWIEMWVSRDSGRNWSKRSDSLPLGALPERFESRWWSIRRTTGSVLLDARGSFRNAGLKYDSVQIVSSEDGRTWRDEEKLDVPDLMVFGAFRFQRWQNSLFLIGSGPRLLLLDDPTQFWIGDYFVDLARWKFDGGSGGFSAQEIQYAGFGAFPDPIIRQLSYSTVIEKSSWVAGRGFHLLYSGGQGWWFNTAEARSPISTDFAFGLRAIHQDPWILQSELKVLPLAKGGWMVFGAYSAISLDSSLSLVHRLSWPGGFKGEYTSMRPFGLHEELLFGGKILSLTENGIFRGVLNDLIKTDPRGTWVKKTEVPSQFQFSWNDPLLKKVSR